MNTTKEWLGNSRSVHSTLGARNYALNERETNDYYATEPKALELLLDKTDNIFKQLRGTNYNRTLKPHY